MAVDDSIDPWAVKRQLEESQAQYPAKSQAEVKALLDANATLTLEQVQARIRRGLKKNGTDVALNDRDPFGDGDQRDIRSHSKGQYYQDLFATGGDLNRIRPFQDLHPFALAVILGYVADVEGYLKNAKEIEWLHRGSNTNATASETTSLASPGPLVEALERRESALRFSPLLLLVSLGKNIKLEGTLDQDLHDLHRDQVNVAKILLRYGARPDARNALGKTVCHYGAGFRATATTLQIVDYCLQANGSTHLMNQTVELHGLSQTAMNGKQGVARGYHVDTGLRVVQFDREVAIKPENLRLVDFDGKPRVSPSVVRLCDIQDQVGFISLHEVIVNERVDGAQWLLDRNVNLDVTDWNGYSPLSMAMTTRAQLQSKVCRLIHAHTLKSARHERRKQCTQCGKEESADIALRARLAVTARVGQRRNSWHQN